MPYQGAWWNETRNGSGYNLAIDEKGYIFLTWYTYRADGSSTFYVIGNRYETACGQATAATPSCTAQKVEWAETGITGRLTGPVYETANGACPICEYRQNTVAVSALGMAEVVFFGNRLAQLRLPNVNTVITIYPQPLIATIDDQFSDLWSGKSLLFDLVAPAPSPGVSAPVLSVNTTWRITRAPELDGQLRPYQSYSGGSSGTFKPILVSPAAKIYRVVEGTNRNLIAVEPNGKILYLEAGARPIPEYASGGEIFLEGNRMVVWTKEFFQFTNSSTVDMRRDFDLVRRSLTTDTRSNFVQ